MFLTIIAALFLLAGLGSLLYGIIIQSKERRVTVNRGYDGKEYEYERVGVRNPVTAAGVGLLIVSIIIAAFGVVTIVPTRTVGIPITFGVAKTPLSTGLSLKLPWTKVEKMPTTIQPLDAVGDHPTIAKDVDNADVFVYNTVRWSVVQETATDLFLDYQGFEKVSDELVQPKLRTAVATVMQTYNPLADDKPGNSAVAADILDELQSSLGDQIEIHSVDVTLIDVADVTKERINALNTERANTRIAEQKLETAKKEAAANVALSESVSNDPNVLVSKCLDLLDEGKTLPAGFQCWPGQADGQSVIVGGATAS